MFEIVAVIVAVLAVAVGIVLILAAIKPGRFSVRRDIVVRAPAEKISPLIADFHQWVKLVALREQGSRDEAHLWRRGKRQGRGLCLGRQQECRFRPHGNSRNLGAVERSSSSSISSRRSKATTPPSSQCCRRAMAPMSTWLMHGPAPFMSRLMQVFMNMDKMIGKGFRSRSRQS